MSDSKFFKPRSKLVTKIEIAVLVLLFAVLILGFFPALWQ